MDATIDNLLAQINLICKKYDEIDRITGEKFNIFQTLGLQADELSHSKIIAELLNPKGSHGRGDEFLKLFLPFAGFDDASKFENAKVAIERKTENGRVDILITGNQATIVIENKIYAGEQEGQLARYRQDYPTATIVYLTLYGHPPTDYSTRGDKEAYDKSISYQEHIISWLEQCKEKAVNFSYVRETIAQYINLLQSLTGQTRRHEMTDDFFETVARSPENLKSAIAVVKNIDDVKRKILRKHVIPVMETFATERNLISKRVSDKSDTYWGIDLSNELLQRHLMCIHFRFNGKYFDGWFVGICFWSWKNYYNGTGQKNELLEFIKESAKERGRTSDKMWPYGLSEYYGDGEVLADLAGVKLIKEKSIVERGVEEIGYLLKALQEFEENETQKGQCNET